ncbi:NADH:ubiquinone oxidoreductase subunit NDUFA12 [Rhizobium halophytocola]|uniref:NADH:ubiquinone oxidoreductase subunit n=1 Tax=Rhizobium halophytocola TaxID=735519 RepID=A0ABS4DY04_9HYPH|nr:NADH:ubiquinone oxidoreductase subunit NDUFA12 [Rhizobium halophytocola]MBP1850566.1 NADH:ubiquinone oxidoreductase subunit [Rhizobium halophytocola]
MKNFLLHTFTWWNNYTIGTLVALRGFKKVGEDEFGNVYYQGGKSSYGLPKRWVVYAGYADASQIPPGWHGWMHHRTDIAPSEEDYKPREWEKTHRPNMTGTAAAYRPQGAIEALGERPRVTGDYDAWTPGN